MEALAQAGYLAYAIDLPGYGKSSAGTGDARTWLRVLLDLLKIEKPVVVSPSMSGRFALPLVTEDPQRVSGFVAVAPVGIPQLRGPVGSDHGPGAGDLGRERPDDPAGAGRPAGGLGEAGPEGRHPRRQPRPLHERPGVRSTRRCWSSWRNCRDGGSWHRRPTRRPCPERHPGQPSTPSPRTTCGTSSSGWPSPESYQHPRERGRPATDHRPVLGRPGSSDSASRWTRWAT